MEKLIDILINLFQIYESIKSGFESFAFLVRQNIAKKWPTMSRGDKYAAARALVYMGGVARDPRKYFSRELTNGQWVGRAHQWAQEHKIASQDSSCAYYIIQSPTDIVVNKSVWAFDGALNYGANIIISV